MKMKWFKKKKNEINEEKTIKVEMIENEEKKELGEVKFICDVCNRSFSTQRGLNVHKRVHK